MEKISTNIPIYQKIQRYIDFLTTKIAVKVSQKIMNKKGISEY